MSTQWSQPVIRLVLACGASLVLYVLAFGLLLDRPLSHGFLRDRLEAKLARGAAIEGRKLVIMAGSNGPYSHRCEDMEQVIGLPCVNAGVAVGIGLDYLFARWRPLLRAGDVVYLPLEQEQYVRPRSATTLGPDGAIMLRHDRATLWRLSPDRMTGAVFSFDARALVMSGIELALTAFGFHDPRADVTGTMNAWGDQVGHSADRARANTAVLAVVRPVHQSAHAIKQGDGAAEVKRFIAWAAARGVTVYGGFPTGFADTPIPWETAEAIRAVYRDRHGTVHFLDLHGQARYPRSWFFDTQDHLHEDAQRLHSRLVAEALASVGLVFPPADAVTGGTATAPALVPTSSAAGARL